MVDLKIGLSRLSLAAVSMLLAAGSIRGADVPGDNVEVKGAEAPAAFAVEFTTTKGRFVVEAYREWAPHATARFYELVTSGYFVGNVFWWVKLGDSVAFGFHDDPARTELWNQRLLAVDPPSRAVRAGDLRMYPSVNGNVEPTLIGIQTGLDASGASKEGAAPFGRVVEGLEVLDHLDDSHMRKASKLIRTLVKDGGEEAQKKFPNLDRIVAVKLLDREVAVPDDGGGRGCGARGLDPEMAQVRVYRPEGLKQNFTIRVDGTRRAVLKPGTYFDMTLPAGSHEFAGKVKVKLFATGLLDKAFSGKEVFAFELDAGCQYYLRAQAGGAEGRLLLFRLVATEIGGEESEGLAAAKIISSDGDEADD